MEIVVLTIISAIISLWLGSMEIRMRDIDKRLRDAPSRKEVSEEIQVRQETLKAMQQEIKEDIKYMRHQLDKLLNQ